MNDITFYVLSAFMLCSSSMVVSVKNPIHSVLFLIFSFFNAAGLFILIGAEYIAMVLLVVYVGAVAVLFLFVVMMIDTNETRRRESFLSAMPIAFALSVIMFLEIYFALERSEDYFQYRFEVHGFANNNLSNVEKIAAVLYTQYALQFQIAGLILLVAMIGAILLTLRHSKEVKRQNASSQVFRTRYESVKLSDVKFNEGVEL